MSEKQLNICCIFNLSFLYAFQVILVLASQINEKWVSVKDISKRIGGPTFYLAKICHDLTRKGILISRRGPHGGFKLAEGAGKLTPNDIVEIIFGGERANECPFCIPGCGPDNPCPVHEQWMEVVRHIETFMIGNTISSLANR